MFCYFIACRNREGGGGKGKGREEEGAFLHFFLYNLTIGPDEYRNESHI